MISEAAMMFFGTCQTIEKILTTKKKKKKKKRKGTLWEWKPLELGFDQDQASWVLSTQQVTWNSLIPVFERLCDKWTTQKNL